MGRPINRHHKTKADQVENHVAEQHTPAGIVSRNVFLHGDITEGSIANIIAQMFFLAEESLKPINLIISTYGGSVDELFGLYDIIKSFPCPIHTVGLGKVMSAGVLLLSAGTKGKRAMGSTSRIMIHSVLGGVSGNIFEMENEVEEQRRLQEIMVDKLVNETKMSRTKIVSLMESRVDQYLTAPQAVELGIVDRIIGA